MKCRIGEERRRWIRCREKNFEPMVETMSSVCTKVGAASEYCASDTDKKCAPIVSSVKVVGLDWSSGAKK